MEITLTILDNRPNNSSIYCFNHKKYHYTMEYNFDLKKIEFKEKDFLCNILKENKLIVRYNNNIICDTKDSFVGTPICLMQIIDKLIQDDIFVFDNGVIIIIKTSITNIFAEKRERIFEDFKFCYRNLCNPIIEHNVEIIKTDVIINDDIKDDIKKILINTKIYEQNKIIQLFTGLKKLIELKSTKCIFLISQCKFKIFTELIKLLEHIINAENQLIRGFEEEATLLDEIWSHIDINNKKIRNLAYEYVYNLTCKNISK
jgi:hypothetical protein